MKANDGWFSQEELHGAQDHFFREAHKACREQGILPAGLLGHKLGDVSAEPYPRLLTDPAVPPDILLRLLLVCLGQLLHAALPDGAPPPSPSPENN